MYKRALLTGRTKAGGQDHSPMLALVYNLGSHRDQDDLDSRKRSKCIDGRLYEYANQISTYLLSYNR